MMGVICKAVRSECGFFAMRTGFFVELVRPRRDRVKWRIFEVFMIFSAFSSKKSLITGRKNGIIPR